MINWIVNLIILLSAIPVGFLISWMANDELISGRKYFRILIILGIILGSWFYITGFIAESLISLFISIVSFISYLKSFR